MQQQLTGQGERAARLGTMLKYLSPAGRIRERKTRCLSLEERLQERMQGILGRKRHELELYIERIKGLSPLDKLSSGFSYVEDAEGKNIRSISQVEQGQPLTIHVRDGVIKALVTGKEGSI